MAVTCGHHPGGRRRRTSNLVVLPLALGMALVIAGALVIARGRLSRAAYRDLAREAAPPAAQSGRGGAGGGPEPDRPRADGAGGGVDWDHLRRQNADVAAWVRVDGTDIDLPVVAPRDGDMTWYLSHDLWGDWSLSGTPFIDHRASADGAHRLAYGHHLYDGGQFSELQRAYQPEVFAKLGDCHWLTPRRGETVLRPLCAMSVDMWYEPIQTFDFPTKAVLSEWLADLVEDSNTRSDDADSLVRESRSALTLVTCSSDLSHQRWRTLVVFVDALDARSLEN